MPRTLALSTAWLFVLVVSVVFPRTASAHGMRTAYLELTEQSPGNALALLRVTVPDPSVRPRAEAPCVIVDDGPRASLGAATARSYVIACAGALEGRTIGIDGLGPVVTDAVVRVTLADGRELSHVLTPSSSAWVVPARESWLRVYARYAALGFEHIVSGPDHLLFLLALVLLVRRVRAVFVTETAFTLSHTLSFSATALGWIRVAPLAAEACIALSLVLVALDIGRKGAARASHGALLAFVFGLVHGLGFAGGLRELGVPEGAAASALVGFGFGVEMGQVAFLVALLVLMRALERSRIASRLPLAGAYAVGVIGCFWLIERTAAFVRP